MEKLSFLDTAKIQHSDDLLKMGKYSILVCIFTELAMLSQLSNTMYMIYAGSTPLIKSCDNETFSSNIEACQNWDYCKNSSDIEFDRQFYGITEQFMLFCDDAKLEKMGISIQMFGLMLGCLVFGQIADSSGRRMPMMICLLMCSIFGILSAFATSFWVFTALRTVLCFFNVVYMIENVPKKSRMYLSTLISFSPNVIILGVIAWLFQKWDLLAIVISILIIPAIIILVFLHESPRWLMQKGKIEQAKKTILKIDKFDGSKVPLEEQDLSELLKNEHEQFSKSSKTQHSFGDLFSTKETAIGILVIAFTFFSTTFINYANMFNLGSISGSIYMNSIIIGLLRYSISIFCGFLDFKLLWFNRKMSHGLCSCFTILAILITIGIKVSGSDDDDVFGMVVRFCVLASCTMTSQAIIVASVTCNELMPTAIRSLAYSIAQLSSRFGIVLSPHLFFLHLYLGDGLDVLPYLIALIFAITDLIFFKFLIPETKNKPLQDHIRK